MRDVGHGQERSDIAAEEAASSSSESESMLPFSRVIITRHKNLLILIEAVLNVPPPDYMRWGDIDVTIPYRYKVFHIAHRSIELSQAI